MVHYEFLGLATIKYGINRQICRWMKESKKCIELRELYTWLIMLLDVNLSQVSVGNVNNFLKETGKLTNPDDTKRKGSPKKEKEKESDTRKDSPRRKPDEVSCIIFVLFSLQTLKASDVTHSSFGFWLF